MKKIGRIYRWIVISIVLQVIVLSYINFIYLPGSSRVRSTVFEFQGDGLGSKKLSIPETAENVRASFDGSFISYSAGNRLELVSTANKRNRKTVEPAGLTISCYRWLPDRNMVIYAMKSSQKQDGIVKISTYDVDSGIERSYPDIKDLPEGSEVVGMELSPLTNVVYMKVKTSDSHARIYKFNIMDHLQLVMRTGVETIVKELNYSDHLVYQDSSGKILVRSGKNGSIRQLSFKGETSLLEVDSKDRIYVARLNEDGKAAGIYAGSMKDPTGQWERIDLNTPLPPEGILITRGGKLYRHKADEGLVSSLDNVVQITYKGSLIEILDDYMVVRDGSSLKLISMKEGES